MIRQGCNKFKPKSDTQAVPQAVGVASGQASGFCCAHSIIVHCLHKASTLTATVTSGNTGMAHCIVLCLGIEIGLQQWYVVLSDQLPHKSTPSSTGSVL